MFNTLFSKGSLPVLEQILHFTRERHTMLANNIANVETPYYRAVDAPEGEFREALERAIHERDQYRVPVLEFEGTRHVRPKAGGGLSVEAQELVDLDPQGRPGVSLQHDRNNVDPDVEFAKMVKNAQLHNAVAQIMSHQFGVLRSAIMERVG